MLFLTHFKYYFFLNFEIFRFYVPFHVIEKHDNHNSFFH